MDRKIISRKEVALERCFDGWCHICIFFLQTKIVLSQEGRAIDVEETAVMEAKKGLGVGVESSSRVKPQIGLWQSHKQISA